MFIVYPPLCKLITRFCLTSKAQGHKTNICHILMNDLSTVQFLIQNDPSLLLKWAVPKCLLAQQNSDASPQRRGPGLETSTGSGCPSLPGPPPPRARSTHGQGEVVFEVTPGVFASDIHWTSQVILQSCFPISVLPET